MKNCQKVFNLLLRAQFCKASTKLPRLLDGAMKEQTLFKSYLIKFAGES